MTSRRKRRFRRRRPAVDPRHPSVLGRYTLTYESLETRRVLDGSGFVGNDCPPDLDLSAVSDQTVAVGETLNLDLLAAGGTLTDLDDGGQPTGDVLRMVLDPDRPEDVPLGVSMSSGVLTWSPALDQIGTHTIVVIGIDSGSPALADAEILTVEVTAPVNQAPVVDLNGSASGNDTSASFLEDGGAAAIVDAALAITDADDTDMSSAAVTITNLLDGIAESLDVDTASTSILSSYNSTTGVLSLTGVDSIAAYEQVLRTLVYANTSDNPNATDRIVTVTVNDGLADSPIATSLVTIEASNDAPSVDLNGDAGGVDTSASFTEGDLPVSIVDAALVVSDVDNVNSDSATVTITNLLDGAAESLAVDVGTTGISSDYNSTTGVLSLTGTDTLAAYEQVLRSLTYHNTSDNPDPTTRTVTVTVHDGQDGSAVATSLVSVSAVNDAPVVDLNGDGSGLDTSALFTEDDGPISAVDPTLIVSDVDGTNLDSATVTITNLLDGAAETLAVDLGTTGISGFYVTTTGVLSLTGTDTHAAYEQVLRSLVYNNTSQNPDTTDRVITVTVDDGSDTSLTAESVISITPQNDAPDLASIANRTAFVDQQLEVTVTATDPDGDNLTFQIDDDPGTPANATLEQTPGTTTAVIRWTPTDADGGGDFNFRILVTDDGTLPLSDSEAYTVTVEIPVEVAAPAAVLISGDPLPPPPDTGADPGVGQTAPDFSTLTYTGEVAEITHDGAISTLVGFVAHWCSHCQAEIPQVVDWLGANDLPENVRLVLVSTNVSPTSGNYPPSEWLVREEWPLDVFVDAQDSAIAVAHGLRVFPYWVSVDADGSVIERHEGQITNEQFSDLVAKTATGLP